MTRKYGALLASIVVGFGALLLAAPATATPAPITATHDKRCGYVDITFTNTTAWTFSADIKVDHWAGSADDVTGTTIANGRYAGMPYGNRYRPITLPPGETVTKRVKFGEDSGPRPVQYRVWRGPETDYYVDWNEEFRVWTDCKPKPSDPPQSPSGEPSETPSDPPSETPSEPPTSPSNSPTAVPSTPAITPDPDDAGDLPVTGAGLAGMIAVGLGLVSAGGAALWLIRRRREVL